MTAPTAPKKLRGFQAITPERRREIASMGGKAAHLSGRAHEFDSEQAREAGRKGAAAKKLRKAPKSVQGG